MSNRKYDINDTYPSGWQYPRYKRSYVVIQYALRVVNDEILTSEYEKLACMRFLNDLEKSKQEDYPYIFDTTRADRFFTFCNMCNHIEGVQSGTPIELLDWQKFDYGNLFGWVQKESGKRRYDKFLNFMPRGQAKSTMCSVVANYGLNADVWYPPYHPEKKKFALNPSIICIAVDKAQARIVRDAAFEMARRSELLNNQVIVKKTFMENRQRGGELITVSQDTGNKDGTKEDILIADEYAAWKNDKALNTLIGGFGKKPQCLLILITTAGDDCMTKPALSEYKNAVAILKGENEDDKYCIMIRQMPRDMKIDDFEQYKRFTPMLRVDNEYSQKMLETIKTEYERAFIADSPSKKKEYLIKRCNQWQVESEDKYLDSECLSQLRNSYVPRDEFIEMVKGRNAIAGFDMSKKVDLTAMGVIWKLDNERYAVYAHGFMPEQSLRKHIATDGVPYDNWVSKDYINLIEGSVIDTFKVGDYMALFEKEIGSDFRECVYDPAWCSQFACDMSEGRNATKKAYNMIEMPQTTTHLNEPTQKFRELLISGKLVICENECFNWCCENAYIERDKGGREKIAKRNKDSRKRIDLLAAVLFAFGRVDSLNSDGLVNSIINGTFSF